MAESTLAITLSDIRTEVCDYLGIGRTYSSASATDQARVDAIIKAGLSSFYFNKAAHRWSFLEPETTLAIVAADSAYDMPDDFGFILSPFTFTVATYSDQRGVTLVSEAVMRQMKQREPTASGPPLVACITPKTNAGTSTGQRYEVQLHPIPDASYTLRYRYSILPDVLTGSVIYPYGGSAYGQTILQACLAVAEQRYNDAASTNHQQEYAAMLAAAIERDRRFTSVSSLGYNGDPSTGSRDFLQRPTISVFMDGTQL